MYQETIGAEMSISSTVDGLVSFMGVAHVISYFGMDIVRNPGTRLTYLPLPHGESIGPLSS